ncbi:DNA polymerase III subunit beta [Paenibacillus gallinarum]|uniref:Beta sliding clamp n=1 Tax=Paenibacillus gallinarum TaxID=2762232 RepID=A0ABR8T2F3_9BACL|nr:DNA polymerase III subunit beta [Paenibacillus gallinarum]MBD7969941.1 DNA polymerase III subunit beta [Paenibacillus gallinarum]
MINVLLVVAREELYQALRLVMRAVSQDTMLGISGVHIQANKDRLTLTASNSTFILEHIVITGDSDDRICSIEQTGSIIVPATYLYEIIRKLGTGFVTLEASDKSTLLISSNKAHFRIRGTESADYFPLLRHNVGDDKTRFFVSNKALLSAIKQTLSATVDTLSRPLLTGVLFEYKDKKLTLTATDSIKLATMTIEVLEVTHDIGQRVVVPRKSLKELLKVIKTMEGTTEIQINTNNIKFRSGQIELQSVLLQGDYPHTEHLIPKSTESEVTLHTASLLQSIERASVLASENLIHISVIDNKIMLHSHLSEVGDMNDELSISTKTGNDFQISLNSKFVLDALRHFDTENTTIRYGGHLQPVIFEPADADRTYCCLIPPVRTSHR